MHPRPYGKGEYSGQVQLTAKGSSIPGTYFRLGYIKVPGIEEAFDSRNLLLSTALDPKIQIHIIMSSLYITHDQ